MKGTWIFLALSALMLAACKEDDEPALTTVYSTFWVERGAWTTASIPVDENVDQRRGRLRWWNPNLRDQVPVHDVHPDRELNSQVPNTIPSLELEFEPDSLNGLPDRSWGGVMRYLGEDFADQTHTQFLEFWLKFLSETEGRLVIDFGEISEDALPNNVLDTEDLNGNGVLDPNEDGGLDGIFGADPLDSADWNGVAQPRVPSWDDWFHAANSSDFTQVNGTENSRNDESGTYPDTEDLNADDDLNTANNYYSYSLALDDDNPYIVGGFDNVHRWRQFRIPLHSVDPDLRRTVGLPDFGSMRSMRLYLTGTTFDTRLEMVELALIPEEE